MDYNQLRERVLRVLRESRDKAVEDYPPETGNPTNPCWVGAMSVPQLEKVLPTHLYQKGLLGMVLRNLDNEGLISFTWMGYAAKGGEKKMAPYWEEYQNQRRSLVKLAEDLLQDYPDAEVTQDEVRLPLTDFLTLLQNQDAEDD